MSAFDTWESNTATWCEEHADERATCGCPWGDREDAVTAGSAGKPDAVDATGSAGITGVTGSPSTPLKDESTPAESAQVLDDVRQWLARYVRTMHEDDLDVLTLWAAHTHLMGVLYTTPRLILDSPVPDSGKTTCLEHLHRLANRPVQMASVSSPALLVRLLDGEMRTLLIDEADRTLDPKREGVNELLAVLNSGYKRGGMRPVLMPTKDGWEPREMSTFAPVAMAGNNPDLPEDTRSRTIRVLLLPALEGQVEETDWELIEDAAEMLGGRLARWCAQVLDDVQASRPPLPKGVVGRGRERWSPLKRIAVMAGGRWSDAVDRLAIADLARIAQDKEDGMIRTRPHMVLIHEVAAVWPDGETFVTTEQILTALVSHDGDMWGAFSPYGKVLTAQRLGRMLALHFAIHSSRPGGAGPRGYLVQTFQPVWRNLGIVLQGGTGGTGDSGYTGGTGGLIEATS